MTHEFTPAIVIHLAAALTALALGARIFLAAKGTPAHRLLGRTWAILMLVTAVSTWWIRSNGGFSWIHALSVFSLFVLACGVYYAATGRITRHLWTMRGLYLGGLVLAGSFTLLPQRLLGNLLWSAIGLA